jgi:sec-independent protein translocase protein TatA
MPNVGPMELAIVLVVALIVLGPKRLPEVGRSLGNGIREFKDSIQNEGRRDDDEFKDSIQNEGRRDDDEEDAALDVETPPKPVTTAAAAAPAAPAAPEPADDKS